MLNLLEILESLKTESFSVILRGRRFLTSLSHDSFDPTVRDTGDDLMIFGIA
jgi:hypothetical protein